MQSKTADVAPVPPSYELDETCIRVVCCDSGMLPALYENMMSSTHT